MPVLCVRLEQWSLMSAEAKTILEGKMRYEVRDCKHHYQPWRTVGAAATRKEGK